MPPAVGGPCRQALERRFCFAAQADGLLALAGASRCGRDPAADVPPTGVLGADSVQAGAPPAHAVGVPRLASLRAYSTPADERQVQLVGAVRS